MKRPAWQYQRANVKATYPTSNFSFNMAASLKRAGDIMVNAIPHIYDTARVVRILGEDDTGKATHINGINIEQGVGSIYNDITQGRYDVAVNIGPSFATRRQESLELLKSMIGNSPELTTQFLDLLFDLADIPNSEAIKKRARKIMPPHLVEGDDKDAQEIDPAQQQQQQLAMQNAELELRLKTAETIELEAKAKKASAEADNEMVDTALKKFELAEKAGALPPGASAIFRTIMDLPVEQIAGGQPAQPQQPPPQQAPENAFAAQPQGII